MRTSTECSREAGIKLSAVLSDVMGLSGRAILNALCAGESDPQCLAMFMHRSVHATQEQVTAALTAEVREHLASRFARAVGPH